MWLEVFNLVMILGLTGGLFGTVVFMLIAPIVPFKLYMLPITTYIICAFLFPAVNIILGEVDLTKQSCYEKCCCETGDMSPPLSLQKERP